MKTLLLCLVFVAAQAFAENTSPPELADNLLMVSGSAERVFAPDRAEVSLMLRFDASTLEEALSKAETADASVRALVRKYAPGAVVRIVDSYEYSWQSKNHSRTLVVSLTDLKPLQSLMTRIAAVPGVSIGRADFQSSEFAKHKRAARRQAAELAKEKAEDFAAGLGRKLGLAVHIEEGEEPRYGWFNAAPAPARRARRHRSDREARQPGE